MIDWTESMEQMFEYYEVDPATWKDVRLIDTIKSASISYDDDSDTLGSASFEVTNTFGECYVRVYLIAIQNGIRYKQPLGTFLLQTPSSTFDGKVTSSSIDAYTPLIELKEKMVPLGYAIKKDDNILSEAYIMTRDNCRAPVVQTVSDKTLVDNFVANTDDKWITYIRDLLKQAKFKFNLDEMGRILFAPDQKIDELQPVHTFSTDEHSILDPEITLKHDLYGIPNVVEVTMSIGNGDKYTAVAKNEDPNSLTSIQSRGREIIYRESNPSIKGIPTKDQLDEYAENLLVSLSALEYTITFTHGYYPVHVGECVRINYKDAGLEGVKAKITSQSISCKSGCSIKETAVFTKKLYNK